VSNSVATSLWHALAAMAAQAVVGFATGDWWLGGAAAAAWYASREVTQAEYRAIEHLYGGRRSAMPFLGWVRREVWTVKSIIDFVLPAICVSIISYLV